MASQSNPLPRRQFVAGVSSVLVGAACADEGSNEGSSPSAEGGAPNTGGAASATGGASSTGGTASVTGGAPSTGGAAVASGSGGAASASGGEPSAGGAMSTSGGAASGSGGARVTGGAPASASGGATTAARKAASDQVVLGSTGIKVSRLAMGSGTTGSGGKSAQSSLGVESFSSLLGYGHAEQGITFFETADAYGTHPHVGEAIRRVGRENVVVLTKTRSETADGVEADLARFREELGIDTIDIVLLHLKTSSNWTTQCEDAMNVLARAKQGGAIRAHGVSCHSLEALRVAAKEPWVDIDLARVNPAGVVMDSDPTTVISVLREMKTAGKGVIGMKILGEGRLANQLDTAIKHAVDLDVIDAFTIGFTSQAQLDEVVGKIASVQA
jgi:1-deoxyxylulose-5-phosphate synthase